jgi:hypothetical protein
MTDLPSISARNTPTCCPECSARQRAGDVAGTLDVVALMWAVCRHLSPNDAYVRRDGNRFTGGHDRVNA